MTRHCLAVVLHCPVVSSRDGIVEVSAKFLEEVERYAKFWPGTVRLIAYEDSNWGTSFGTVKREIASLPFELVIRSHDELDAGVFADDVAALLCGVGHRYNHLAAIGRDLGVPVVYVAEWSRRTQNVITAIDSPNNFVKARRLFWLWRQRRSIHKSLAAAAALQCNGTPTFDEYAKVNQHRLLYFDNRITDDLLIDPSALDVRLAKLAAATDPLQLVFTGRLTPTKGVLDLLQVVKELRKADVGFELSIVGAGDLADALHAQVVSNGLDHFVKVLAPKEFRTELIPFVQQMDLFVCPHPQGDPSCTYIETLACGVPIVGYANEALEGVVRHSHAGWHVPLGRPNALAAEIVRLAHHRGELAAASVQALEFASRHTFDLTYGRRVDQLRELAGV
ncbi:MAG: glycosyltransferase family 4 protein [Actinomycetia bacterium]|nr:glycosyltransferase family 4 protein [Actinomycetes bacterium]